jgi:uncharacterized membrane protein
MIGAILVILIVVMLLVALVSILLYPPDSGGYNWQNGFPAWIISLVIIVVILSFVMRMVFWTVFGPQWRHYRRWKRKYGPNWVGDEAEEILDQRYARGEITREQYLQMIEDLKKRRV